MKKIIYFVKKTDNIPYMGSYLLKITKYAKINKTILYIFSVQ